MDGSLFCLQVTILRVVSPYGFHMAEGGNCKLAFSVWQWPLFYHATPCKSFTEYESAIKVLIMTRLGCGNEVYLRNELSG